MSENTPSSERVSEDSETSAMNAWLALPEEERKPYVATGVPIRDTSSQMPEPKDVKQAICWGLIHN